MGQDLKGIRAVIEARADFRSMYRQMPQVLVVHPSRANEVLEGMKQLLEEAAKEFKSGTHQYSTHAHGKIQNLVLGMRLDVDHGFAPEQGEVRVPPDQRLEFTL